MSGPLVAGFDPLPGTITANFRLRGVVPGASVIGLDQVASFELEIPGDNPSEGDLDSFQLALDSGGSPLSLNWVVQGFDNGFAPGIIIANNSFTLDISGADPATGQPFRYFWSESTNAFAPVPEPSVVLLALSCAAVLALRLQPQRGGPTPAQASGLGPRTHQD